MKISQLIVTTTLALMATATFAQPSVREDVLEVAHEQTINQYLNDLQKGDYQDIVNLFTADGIVISTSKGEMPAKDFYYSFMPDMASGQTELHQLFIGKTAEDPLAARFHLHLDMKSGSVTDGEYMDEFIFAQNSSKLSAVYMFENSHFPPQTA